MKLHSIISVVMFGLLASSILAANLTPSNVTIVSSYAVGDRTGKYVGKSIHAQVVLATNGTWTDGNRIPASAFGLSKVISVSNLTGIADSTNSVVVAGVHEDLKGIVLKNATNNTLANYSGTYRLTVIGE